MSDANTLQPPEQPPKEKKKKKSGVKASDLPKTEKEGKKSSKSDKDKQPAEEGPPPQPQPTAEEAEKKPEEEEEEEDDDVVLPYPPPERKKSGIKYTGDNQPRRKDSKSLLEVDYVAPPAATKKDIELLHNIDEEKMRQLKDAFMMFDFNHDGVIGRDDLKMTLTTLGRDDVTDDEVECMLSDALHPLDFDAFVVLLGCKTIELDPEEVIRDALSRWDYDGSGWINEQRIRHDLMTWGDRFTPEEVDIALEDAPVHDDFRETADQRMIDYVKFCKTLCGLRAKTAD